MVLENPTMFELIGFASKGEINGCAPISF